MKRVIFIDRDGRQLAVVAPKDQAVRPDFVVGIALVVLGFGILQLRQFGVETHS